MSQQSPEGKRDLRVDVAVPVVGVVNGAPGCLTLALTLTLTSTFTLTPTKTRNSTLLYTRPKP